ncbi:HAD-IC family P-type ATPase, partial [Streptomyces sp. SAS_267]|uniref:HAD-IC family P-type ATPase n=1 Tax=Streptomyces sp. SAS_267 TaxID=3412750 RepID=UPI00403CBA9C
MHPPQPSALAPESATNTGLSDEEAHRLLERCGPNELGEQKKTTLRSRIFAQLRDPLILVLLVAAALTVATGDFADAVVICVVILFNTTVGVAQEVRADNAVAALSAMTAPTARVTRDGVEQQIPSSTVVPGDALVLGEGDIIPADAALTYAAALIVDESALTGESVPVDKDTQATGPQAGQ